MVEALNLFHQVYGPLHADIATCYRYSLFCLFMGKHVKMDRYCICCGCIFVALEMYSPKKNHQIKVFQTKKEISVSCESA